MRKIYHVFLLQILAIHGLHSQWIQMGKDRFPASGDENTEAQFGTSVDLSASGEVLVMAVQAPNDTAYVRAYDWSGSYWIKRSPRLELEPNPWGYKNSVAVSADGNAVAVTYFDQLNGDLICEVYDWYGGWNLRGDPMVDPQPCYLNQGKTLDLAPDGNTVVISSQSDDASDEMVQIYDWIDSAWVARPSIDPGIQAGQGYNCSASESASSVAISTSGSWCDDSVSFDAWNVKIYDWDGYSWSLRGFGISDMDINSCAVYASLSIDANALAVSVPPFVRVYDWDGATWQQRSNQIEVESDGSGSGAFLVSNPVDISWDGNVFAVGIPQNFDGAGQVASYAWTGTGWLKLGSELSGDNSGDHFGYNLALSASGLVMAVGVPDDDSIAVDAGMVRVFRYSYSADAAEFENTQFRLWPNPTTGEVNFSSTMDLVEIYNALGNKLLEIKEASSINLEILLRGIYFVRSGSSLQKLVLE